MVWWLWVMLGVLAIAGESFSMALFLLNVGIAAFIVAPLALLGTPVAVQASAFVALSVALIGLARPRMLRRLLKDAPERLLTTPGDLAGRSATVTETIGADEGMVRVGKAEFWTARPALPNVRIEDGARVRIVRIEGLTAIVEPELAAAPPTPGALPQAPSPVSFAEMLKGYRAAANLTQEELAERARLSVRAISDLERGLHRSPQRETIVLLAVALQLPDEQRSLFEAAARRAGESPSPSRGR